MIATFPNFDNLELSHKDPIRNITEKYDPYSDFNFTSLYCWNLNNSTAVSTLNNNLIIRLADYLTGDVIHSLLGETKIDESLSELLKHDYSLKLVPETVIKHINQKQHFKIIEDPDNFDYIYSLRSQSELAGKTYKGKRKKNNSFIKNFGADLQTVKLIFGNKSHAKTTLEIFDKWSTEKLLDATATAAERNAIERLLNARMSKKLMGIIIFIENNAVGFSINEVISADYAICHFQKTLPIYKGIDTFLTILTSKELRHFDCEYVNWEQDLGVSGLKQFKLNFKPDKFLKKYTVTRV